MPVLVSKCVWIAHAELFKSEEADVLNRNVTGWEPWPNPGLFVRITSETRPLLVRLGLEFRRPTTDNHFFSGALPVHFPVHFHHAYSTDRSRSLIRLRRRLLGQLPVGLPGRVRARSGFRSPDSFGAVDVGRVRRAAVKALLAAALLLGSLVAFLTAADQRSKAQDQAAAALTAKAELALQIASAARVESEQAKAKLLAAQDALERARKDNALLAASLAKLTGQGAATIRQSQSAVEATNSASDSANLDAVAARNMTLLNGQIAQEQARAMLNALQVARKEAQSAQSSVDRSNLIQIVATLCGFGLLVFQGVNKALADSKERGKARAAEHAAMTVAKEQNAQLGQIHALVNSKMTEQMESELRPCWPIVCCFGKPRSRERSAVQHPRPMRSGSSNRPTPESRNWRGCSLAAPKPPIRPRAT